MQTWARPWAPGDDALGTSHRDASDVRADHACACMVLTLCDTRACVCSGERGGQLGSAELRQILHVQPNCGIEMRMNAMRAVRIMYHKKCSSICGDAVCRTFPSKKLADLRSDLSHGRYCENTCF